MDNGILAHTEKTIRTFFLKKVRIVYSKSQIFLILLLQKVKQWGHGHVLRKVKININTDISMNIYILTYQLR